jgi:cell division protein FtsN
MSDYDRGPYTPPSDRLAFDPRQPVRGGPAPTTLIMSALVLAAIVGGVFFMYRHGFRRHDEAPATVGTPVTDMKTPVNAAANTAEPQQLIIEKTNPANAAPQFAPPPEEPLPRPTVAAAPPAPVAPPPAAKPAIVRPAPAPTIDSLVAGSGAVKPAAKPPAAKLATGPANGAVTAGTWVQIGAFSSAALADKGWSDAARLEGAAMGGKGKKVEPVSAGGATLYRAYVTGFSTRDAAQGFCDKLKAAGKACFVK